MSASAPSEPPAAAGRAGPAPTGGGTGRLGAAAILLVLAGVLGFRLTEAPVSGAAELRCHEVARAMVESGDWLVPRQRDEVRINKPPLYYWLAAGTATVLGGHDELALRLPSLLACLAMVAATMAWGGRLGGVRLALLAGALLALMKDVQEYARLGEAEITLAWTCTAALATFDRIHHGGRRGRLPLFAGWLALAVLSKATAAVLVVGLPIVVHLAWRRELRGALRPAALAWTAAGLAAGIAWYAAVLAVEPGAWERLVSEAVLPLGVQTEDHTALHYGGFHEHFANLLKLAVPATVLLPALLWRAWTTRMWREAPRLRFAAVTVVSVLLAFSLMPQKRSYYLLPLMPAFAILTAESALAALAERPPSLRRMRRLVAAFVLITGGVVTWQSATWLGRTLGLGTAVWVGGLAAGGLATLAAAVLVGRGRPAAGGLAFAALWVALMLVRHGSLDVWERQFKVGTMVLRPDFDAAHWSAMRAQDPDIAEDFQVDRGWVGRFADRHTDASRELLETFTDPPKHGR